MAVAIETISPGRGREGDAQTINGSGFGSYGNNQVRLDDGTGPQLLAGATVTTVDENTITFFVPAGLVRDRFVVVEVTNTEDNTTASWWFYSQLTIAELEVTPLPGKKPGQKESTLTVLGVPDEDSQIQEAKDWNRLASKIDLASELYSAKGDLVALGPDGVRSVAAGADYTRFFRDPQGVGGFFREWSPEILWWAAKVVQAEVTERILPPQELASTALGAPASYAVYQAAGRAGQLALLEVFVNDDSTGSASRITRIRVEVNDVEVFDSDDLATLGEDPFVGAGGTWSAAPFIQIDNADDLISVAVTKPNAANDLNVQVRAVIL